MELAKQEEAINIPELTFALEEICAGIDELIPEKMENRELFDEIRAAATSILEVLEKHKEEETLFEKIGEDLAFINMSMAVIDEMLKSDDEDEEDDDFDDESDFDEDEFDDEDYDEESDYDEDSDYDYEDSDYDDDEEDEDYDDEEEED